MALPRAVVEQNELADRLMQEQRDLAASAATSAPEGNTEIVPASTDLAAPVIDPTIAPIQQQTPPQTDDWKHKFDVLQGKYNKEVREVLDANKSLNVMLANQNTLMLNMQSRIAELEATKIVAPAPVAVELSDAEKLLQEEFPDVWNGVQARESKMLATIKALETRIEQVGGQAQTISQNAAASTRKDYLTSLDTVIAPNWREVRDSQEFLAFLQEVEPLTGATYAGLLNDADGKNEAARTAYIYKTFMTRTPSAPVTGTKKDLSELVVPQNEGGTKTLEGSQQNDNEVFTTSAVSNFYTQQALGKLKMSKDEALKYEGRILKARAEGRIIPG